MKLAVHYLTCLAFFLTIALARAEVPPRSPESLQEDAETIVTGKVGKIATLDKKIEAHYVNTIYTIEVKVVKVHKGNGVSVGDTIAAKAWHSKERPKLWVGPSGNWGIPKEGETVKFYLNHENGELSVLTPNGIEPGS